MEIINNLGYLVITMIVYFLLQILGSFIEFGIFGSGGTIKGKELYIPIAMLVIQILIIILLKNKT
ncbi:MAG: hypothetical protein AAF901_11525, partial [Bacteroidota bacterium]